MRCNKDLWTILRTELKQGKRGKPASRHRKDKRTRVGVLSADIGNHVVSRFIKPILRSYDRQTIEIEIICTRRRYDELAEDFKRLCSHIFLFKALAEMKLKICLSLETTT